ncbi:hypothetical protein Tco_1282474 [Tanacetum coccineum]
MNKISRQHPPSSLVPFPTLVTVHIRPNTSPPPNPTSNTLWQSHKSSLAQVLASSKSIGRSFILMANKKKVDQSQQLNPPAVLRNDPLKLPHHQTPNLSLSLTSELFLTKQVFSQLLYPHDYLVSLRTHHSYTLISQTLPSSLLSYTVPLRRGGRHEAWSLVQNSEAYPHKKVAQKNSALVRRWNTIRNHLALECLLIDASVIVLTLSINVAMSSPSLHSRCAAEQFHKN